MNPYPAALMTPAERRTELCRLLALGLIRLVGRYTREASDPDRESSLHFPLEPSGYAAPTHRRPA